jgi:hypothetical protein
MTEVALLAERPESQVSGEAARIYAEIRRLTGVPMAALIYRHLATIPGGLEWAWSLLEPALRGGRVQQPAWRLADAADLPVFPAIPRAALRAVGIGEADERAIVAVLDAYNRANPVNIVALRYLAHHLAGVERVVPVAWPSWEPPVALPPLPAMIDPQAMGTTLRQLMVLLTDRGTDRPPSPLWPSMYRHLAHWPAFLGLASVIVLPAFGAIDTAAERVRRQADDAAAGLAGQVRPTGGMAPPVQGARLLAAIDAFTARIPEMVVIGGLLRRAMPSAA